MADEKIAVETIRVTPTISATITDVYFIEFLNGWYLANVIAMPVAAQRALSTSGLVLELTFRFRVHGGSGLFCLVFLWFESRDLTVKNAINTR
ncbi:MAG: hypothetical protein ACQ9IQ_13320 [Nitrospirales bacterium]